MYSKYSFCHGNGQFKTLFRIKFYQSYNALAIYVLQKAMMLNKSRQDKRIYKRVIKLHTHVQEKGKE